MSFRVLAPLIVGLAGLVLSGPTCAQPTRVPTVTRLVKAFAELEAKLDDAVAASDRSALESLLTKDFELRVGYGPGTPISRAEWLDAIAKQRNVHARDDQFAVHDAGGVALVSFRQMTDARSASPVFVIDVWRKVGDDWKLAIRYAASGSNVTIAGAVAKKSFIPKKY